MWPLESAQGVVRVGAYRVEHWRSSPEGLILVGAQGVGTATHGATDPTALLAALNALLTTGHHAAEVAESKGLKPTRRAHLVVESAWLPMILLETGQLWSRAQLDPLLRHRLGRLFDTPGTAVSTWDLLIDHRAGDEQGMGYGLAPEIKAVFERAETQVGIRWTSMQPAFAWGWQRLSRRRATAEAAHWWLWLEQDRTMACHVDGGQVRAMNPAAAPITDTTPCRRTIEIECVRLGVSSDKIEGWVAGWQQALPSSLPAGLSWVSVAATVNTLASATSPAAMQPSPSRSTA